MEPAKRVQILDETIGVSFHANLGKGMCSGVDDGIDDLKVVFVFCRIKVPLSRGTIIWAWKENISDTYKRKCNFV